MYIYMCVCIYIDICICVCMFTCLHNIDTRYMLR